MGKRKLFASDRAQVGELLRRLAKSDGKKLTRVLTAEEKDQVALAAWIPMPEVDPIEAENAIAELSGIRARTAERLTKARGSIGPKRRQALAVNRDLRTCIQKERARGISDVAIADLLGINRKRLVRLAGKRGRLAHRT